MSRVVLSQGPIQDPEANYQLQQEIDAELEFFYNHNSLRGIKTFDAICLSGGPQAEQVTDPSGSMNTYYPIKVRINKVHAKFIPDPCSKEYADESKTAAAKKLISYHHTAYPFEPLGGGQRTPGFGETIKCEFTQFSPYGTLRGIRYHYPTQPVSYNYECANATLQSMVGQIFNDQTMLLGGLAAGQGDRPTSEYGLGQPPADAMYLGKGKRTRDVTHIVVHTTAGWSKKGAIRTLMRKHLSYHFIIDYDGTVENLLDPAEFVAYHAPPTNSYSIGISFVNVAYERDGVKEKAVGVNTAPWQTYEWVHPRTGRTDKRRKWQPFTPQQISSYVTLVKRLVTQFKINRENIKMHAEVSTSGKMDPGPAFPWNETLDQIY